MRKSLSALAVLATACMAIPALAADLNPDERSELRSRADGLIAKRQSNPDWDGGTTRMSQARSDVQLDKNQGDVKMRPRGDVKAKVKGAKKPKEGLGKRMKRAAKSVPGALVRDR
jgi:hypothetical protein